MFDQLSLHKDFRPLSYKTIRLHVCYCKFVLPFLLSLALPLTFACHELSCVQVIKVFGNGEPPPGTGGFCLKPSTKRSCSLKQSANIQPDLPMYSLEQCWHMITKTTTAAIQLHYLKNFLHPVIPSATQQKFN